VQIRDFERSIAGQGAHIKALVERYNTVEVGIQHLDREIALAERQLREDQANETAAQAQLRRVAVNAYVTGGELDSPLTEFASNRGTVMSTLTRQAYLGVMANSLADTLDHLRSTRQQTNDDANTLQSKRADATLLLSQLTAASNSVETAIAADTAALTLFKNDATALVAAASARQASQLANERVLAAIAVPARVGPPQSIPPPTPGTYDNPLRDITGLTAGRIDQGVDYGGFGPIHPIGDAIVLATTIPGWPGGTMIAYQLTDGPANGIIVYAAEDIAPAVHVGDVVTADTVLGLMYAGPDGIETGWGDTAIIGNTMARAYSQFNGTNTTAFGDNFAQLLQSLGAPPGIPQTNPPTGSLPRNWPQWP
jgi:hypothetical protein